MALCYKWDTRSVRLRAPRSKEADFRIPSLLVNEGADPDILKDGSPLLTHALRSKNVLACKALVKAGADLITRIRSLIRAEHFSSKVNYSLDSAADDLIHERKRSVCKVEWPGGSGSGFLIGKNKILTNNHIYEMMKEASKQPDGRSADHRNYRAIFVLSEHQPVVCHMAPKPPLSCGRDLDYAILELAPQEGDNSISDVIPLGQFVSDNLEKDGMVVVVGHPGGGRKKIDFCPISGLDEKYIIHVLFGNPNVPREDIHRATYHTGVMFHGSSGSAGFDRNGNLVLMHTRGFFPIENQTSLIEEGVRLSSIREHARQNLAPEVFNEIFPQRLGGFSFGQ
ncbi:FAM111A [Branchiostoma lanceolatum]|uniref:Serine protease n=1 Tax=Branchiostoma lanceolatum TaxID=7740 RepID=A0A8J9YXE8_BRALA|nr:FAM111A [Branchiostoma lanceolatum]